MYPEVVVCQDLFPFLSLHRSILSWPAVDLHLQLSLVALVDEALYSLSVYQHSALAPRNVSTENYHRCSCLLLDPLLILESTKSL